MSEIHFFTEEIKFSLSNAAKVKKWIKAVIKAENHTLTSLNYIFCSDEYLLAKNIEYLNHNTYTDIITFDNSDGDALEADIFISIDRVKENAEKLNISFLEELHRVLIHGVLHLMGYGDKGAAQKKLMREKEDTYLSLR